MDIATEASVQFARAQIEAGADTIGVGDAVCSQISAATHAQLIWPRQMRLIQAIKDAGALERVEGIGNASLGGASLYLQSAEETILKPFLNACQVIELNQCETFEDHFIDGMPLEPIA